MFGSCPREFHSDSILERISSFVTVYGRKSPPFAAGNPALLEELPEKR
jgi:hypothetical protein